MVQELGLVRKGSTKAAGVGGLTDAHEIALRNWRADSVKLPEQKVLTVDLAPERRDDGLRGLLGADILDDYDSIAIDFQRELLILRPRAR